MQLWLSIVLLAGIVTCTVGSASTNYNYCKLPRLVQNGRHSGQRKTLFPVGFILKYRCNRGYKLQGNQYCKCIHRNGVPIWSTPPPLCISKMN